MNDTSKRRILVSQMIRYDGITPADFPYLFADSVKDNLDGTYTITVDSRDDHRTIITNCNAAYELQQMAILRGQRKLVPRTTLRNLPAKQLLGEFTRSKYYAHAVNDPNQLAKKEQFIDYDGHIYDRAALQLVAQHLGNDVRLEYVLELMFD